MARSSKSRRRSPRPRDPYRRRAKPDRLGDERLRFTLISKDGQRQVGDALTSVRWEDTGMELTGSLDAVASYEELRFKDGDRLRCEYAPSADAPFRRLWTLQVSGQAGDPIMRNLEDDTITATLASTLDRYRGTEMDFSYRKDKKHPKGWRCDQIAKDVAKRTGMPLGKIAKGKHRIKNLVRRNANPVDVILVAYRQERQATGRRFFASWDGRLNITVLTRSKYLLELLPVLMSGQYGEERRPDFATVLDVRLSVPKGKRSRKKVRTRVVDRAGVKQYGRVIKSVSPKGVDSVAEARKWGRESLKRRQSPRRQLTITVPLMPLIRRGDAIRIDRPEQGLRQVVYVRSAAHDWSAGSGQTTLVVRFDDPYKDKRSTKTSKAKADKARKRGKKAPQGSSASASPRPANAARRS